MSIETRRLLRIAVVKTAAISAIIYALIGLIFAPIFLVSMMLEGGFSGLIAVIGIIAIPLLYALLGFIGTAIALGLFNVVAPRLGGVEVEVE